MDRYTKGFVVASLFYFCAAAILGIWMGAAEAPDWAYFAHVHFNLLGFMAMMVYGIGYFILPRFNGKELRWPDRVPIHFYLANIGLIGLVATSVDMPSRGFTLFAIINVISVALFSINIGATILLPAKEEETGVAVQQAEPEIEITPDTRMSEILTQWPELIDILVNNGFTPLADPAHREQIKQMPVTLGMACERHGLDIDMISSLLTQGARSLARSNPPGPQPIEALSAKGTISTGDVISHHHVIGDILKVYPATESVFRGYYGASCFSCPGQATETIRQSAMMHNVDEAKVLADLNEALEAMKNEKCF